MVYLIKLNHEKINDNIVNKILKKTSSNRKKRYYNLNNENHKKAFILMEVLTKKFLLEDFSILNVKFEGLKNKRPIIDNEKICISWSYSLDYILIGITKKALIGVDIEEIKPFLKDSLNYFFTEKEKEYIINSLYKDIAYNFIWTRKESYIKMLSKNLTYDLKSFDVTPNFLLKKDFKYNNQKMNKDCYFENFCYKNHAISICKNNNIKENVKIIELNNNKIKDLIGGSNY